MKFLIISFVAFLAFASLATAQQTPSVEQLRDQLLRRANYLITLVSGEIKLLTVENRQLAADGLELELRALIELELELRASIPLNATQAQVVRLEQLLQGIENRIQQQLTAIGRQFVSRTEIQRLLQGTQELITLVSETVQALRLANRTVEALGLQEEEARLVQLEIQLRATQNSVELRRLEELLVEADYRVYELIQQVERSGVSRRKRDLKADVIARANELLQQIQSAIRALRAQPNRQFAVELLETRASQINIVIADLNNATTELDIGRLEERLVELEFEAIRDLNSVGRPVGLEEFRRELLTVAELLQAWVNYEITQLKAANESAEITVLNRELAAVTQISGELSNATSRADLEALEIRLGEAEFHLYEELLRLAAPGAYRRRLLTQAEDLAVRLVIEIRNLNNRNRSLEAAGLVLQEQELVLLDVEVRDAISVGELQALERRLQALEERIFDELVRLGLRGPRRRDLKADVLARAQELIAITDEAIKAFQAQGNRTQAVQLLQNQERELQAIVAELNAATNESQIGPIEGRLIRAEFQLAADLRRLGRPVDAAEFKELLITRAEGLQQWAAVEINNARNRSVQVHRVEELEQQIAGLITALKNATFRSDILILEGRLNSLEESLIMELRALGSPVISREQVVALERRAEELALQLIIEIRRLYAAGQTLLAEGLQVEERTLIDLDVDLRIALTPERIARVEQRLAAAETRIAAELARIRGTTTF